MVIKLKKILDILRGQTSQIPLVVALIFLVSTLDLITMALLGPFISIISGDATYGGSHVFKSIATYFNNFQSFVSIACLVFIIIFIVKTVEAICINHVLLAFSADQESRLKLDLLKRLQQMDYEKFISKNSSEYLHWVQIVTMKFSVNLLMPLLRLLSDGIIFLCIVAFLAYTNWLALSLLIAIFGLALLAYDSIYKKKIEECGKLLNLSNVRILSLIREAISGFKDIRVLGKEGYFYEQISIESTKSAKLQAVTGALASSPKFFLELTLMAFLMSLIWVTTTFYNSTANLLPTLVIFGFASMRLLPAVYSFSYGLAQMRNSADSIDILWDFLKKEGVQQIAPATGPHFGKFLDLEFSNISFRYLGSSRDVVKNLSLKIKKGENVAFVGPSGSGKTTLVDLLLGILSPTAGLITCNGIDLQASPREWRDKVAYIPQDIFLIDASLAENITLEKNIRNINEKLLQVAIEKAQLGALIEALPLGLDSPIGESGVMLSGGQRQRIAIARAFYNKREILVLDESTSALDSETESQILSQIYEQNEELTVIMITHRVSTIDNCSSVYRIEGGSITCVR